MRRIDIHCCCDAHHIGSCDIPDTMWRPGMIWRVQVYRQCEAQAQDSIFAQIVELEVAWLHQHDERKLALKSHDYPLEILQQLPNFRLASSPDPHTLGPGNGATNRSEHEES